jgi:hypothetical protein
MNQRLQHDVALMITKHCMELLVNVLDHEQKMQAREGIYAICLSGVESYELQVDRMQRRLKPFNN